MKTFTATIILSFFIQGCASWQKFEETLQRSFSHDGLTHKEREDLMIKNLEEQELAAEEERLKREAEFNKCVDDAKNEKLTDMKTYNKCLPPARYGLAKNNIAAFYLWYDGSKPMYVYFDRNEKFIISELDQETINARLSEYRRSMEAAEGHRLQRIQIYNANQNADNLNRTIRKQNCINNSAANTAMYCN